MYWVVVESRFEGLKNSMVWAVVRGLEYYLWRKLGTVRLPNREISYVSTVSVHCRNVRVAKGLKETKCKQSHKRRCGVTYCGQAICQAR